MIEQTVNINTQRTLTVLEIEEHIDLNFCWAIQIINNCLDFKFYYMKQFFSSFYIQYNHVKTLFEGSCKEIIRILSIIFFTIIAICQMCLHLIYEISLLANYKTIGIVLIIISSLIDMFLLSVIIIRIVNFCKKSKLQIKRQVFYFISMISYLLLLVSIQVLSITINYDFHRSLLLFIGITIHLLTFKIGITIEIILWVLYLILIGIEFVLKILLNILLFPYALVRVVPRIVISSNFSEQGNTNINGLTKQQFDSLKVIEFSKNNFQALSCIICLNTFEEKDKIIQLKCHESHIFHYDCIKEWTKQTYNCPNCRTLISIPK